MHILRNNEGIVFVDYDMCLVIKLSKKKTWPVTSLQDYSSNRDLSLVRSGCYSVCIPYISISRQLLLHKQQCCMYIDWSRATQAYPQGG